MTKTKIWQNPYKWYKEYLRSTIEPKSATHNVSMTVEIPKGKTQGRALVPCAMYTLSHEIDLNPSLIRKRDNKIIKKLPVNKRVSFDSNKYDVKLTEEEKLANYKLEEVERCSKCGLKTVIAEVAETRYRSCPDIRVRVSDKAKENLVIPVKFGVRKAEITHTFYSIFIMDFVFIYAVLSFIFPEINILSSTMNKIVGYNHIIGYISIGLVALFCINVFIVLHYKGYKLFKWYNQIKSTFEVHKRKWEKS